MMMRSAREEEMSRAIWNGVVSQDVPCTDFPSGRVMVMGCRGCSTNHEETVSQFE